MARLPRDVLIGFLVVCALAATLMSSRYLRTADLSLFDIEIRWLRAIAPYQPPQDIVVIGIDEQAYEAIAEPYALWHRHLGELFSGIAATRPAVVGLALPLPVRSYEFITKGIDAPLVAGLRQLREAAPLVVGQAQGVGRQLRPIAPELLAAAGVEKVASLILCDDLDGIVRRISSQRCATTDKNDPFAFAIAKNLGREGSPRGTIDFSVGGEIDYIPVLKVLESIRKGEKEVLRQRFEGRVVVIASLLPGETTFRLPVSLAAWDRGKIAQPGVVVQVQALRSLFGRGLIERIDDNLAMFFAGLCTLLWFGRNGWGKSALLALLLATILGGTTMALWHGRYLPPATLLAAALLAFCARLLFETARHYHEKQLLRSAFSGHVSPQVMRAILRGNLQPEGDGKKCKVTVLFADIRGFTARSTSATPEAMIDLLNRFYGEAAAAIQGRGGAIDKYIGDGLLATFGVPQPLAAPERNALEAAQELLVRISRINRQLEAEGLAPIEISIGIHAGEMLAGYVGSRRRREFTVIGDPVNTATQLESLSRAVGYPIVCSHAIASAVGFAGGLVDLGERSFNDCAPVHIWGWNPAITRLVKPGGAMG